LASALGKHQETISQWENPDYGRYNITSLRQLATAFDVALLVKFIPFSELITDMLNLSETRLSPPSFNEEQKISQSLIKIDFNPIDTKDKDAYEPKPIDMLITASTAMYKPTGKTEKELVYARRISAASCE
jgi:transcriptional regulator with XRE-family HTH domain